jgi:hypothetical protein
MSATDTGPRADAATAEQVLVARIPQPDLRREVLAYLTRSIAVANGIAPQAWAVTLFSDGFRLNVGQVEAVVLSRMWFRVNLVGALGTPPFSGDSFFLAQYRSLPQPLCAFVGAVRDFVSLSADLEPAHHGFLSLAARAPSGAPRKGTPFRRSHHAGLVEYARSESQRNSSLNAAPRDPHAGATHRLEAIEGQAREVRALSYGRSAALRDAALVAAAGVCEGCGTDFNRVLGGRGLRALQVHHKNQLSLRDEPNATQVRDLAVLCSNCHSVVHADPLAPLPVEALRALWLAHWRDG